MLVAFWNLIFLGGLANGASCYFTNQPFAEQTKMYDMIAVIGPDDRKDRNTQNTAHSLEAAQGRLYCPARLLKLKDGKLADRSQLIGSSVSNATIAFEDDIALVNRHMFIRKEDGKQYRNPKNCYVEHIPTGTFSAIVDSEWPAYIENSRNMFSHRDFALVRFGKRLNKGSALKDDTFLIEENPDIREKITVVSNYAENRANPESLTITSCQRFGLYKLADGSQSNVYGTDCDTGHGSSGGQAYLERDHASKMIGIVCGEVKKVPEGGQWNSKQLTTDITKFDSTLFEAAEALRSRQKQQNTTDL